MRRSSSSFSLRSRSRSAGSKSSFRMKLRGNVPPPVVPAPYYEETTTVTTPVMPPPPMPMTPITPYFEETTTTTFPNTPLYRTSSNGRSKFSMKQKIRGGSMMGSLGGPTVYDAADGRYSYKYKERHGSFFGGDRSSLKIKERGRGFGRGLMDGLSAMGSYFSGNGLPFTYTRTSSGLPSKLMGPLPTLPRSSTMTTIRTSSPPVVALPPRVPFYEEEVVQTTPLQPPMPMSFTTRTTTATPPPPLMAQAPYYEEEVVQQVATPLAPPMQYAQYTQAAAPMANYRSTAVAQAPYYEESVQVSTNNPPVQPYYEESVQVTTPAPQVAPTMTRQYSMAQQQMVPPQYYAEETVQQVSAPNYTYASQQYQQIPSPGTLSTQTMAYRASTPPAPVAAVPQQYYQEEIVQESQQFAPAYDYSYDTQHAQVQPMQQAVTVTSQQYSPTPSPAATYTSQQYMQAPGQQMTATAFRTNPGMRRNQGQYYEEEVLQEVDTSYAPQYNYRPQYAYGG